MKTSINWMKHYGLSVDDSIETLVQKVGAQLGEVEEVIDLGKKYKGIVVAKVVECEKHPNADKLSVCLIDDGKVTKSVARNDKGLIQVVCGAPNVTAGLLIAWLPPGSVVPSSFDKDPFTLEARDFRGQMSNGMLASTRELAIGEDHDGILVIDEPAKPGDDFAALYGLDDHIIDIENKMFTHRPDCFGQLGVAREISGIYHKTFKSPEWYTRPQAPHMQASQTVKSLKVDNQIPKLCVRYMAVVVENVKVGPSPIWLQTHLSRVGVRPINNIVDMTNYLMLLTGQPLHAFDYDKIAGKGKANIVVRHPKKGETMTLLDGKTITPRSEAILICDQDKPIALGGIMGGNNSEIDEHTTRIIIECANFNMYNVRRTSMEHGLFTDAVTRFSKGQSPLQIPAVLYKAVDMVAELSAEARPVSSIVDVHHQLHDPSSVAVSTEFVNDRLGTKLSLKDIAGLLENVEFKIKNIPADKKQLHITPPFWRTDIEIPEDIVEEVGRLYGYDHLPLTLPKHDLSPAEPNQLVSFKTRLRQLLAAGGANELLTYSFVHGDVLKKVDQDPDNAYQLSNAISPDLQFFRMSLVPGLLDKVRPNIKQGYNEFALFEIGTVHNKDLVDEDKLPVEEKRLGLVFAADEKTAKTNYQGAPYYQVKKYLDYLLTDLGITYVIEPATDHEPKLAVGKQAIAPFEKSRAALVKTSDGQLLGEIGEFKSSVRRNLKLPDFIAGMELDVEQLMNAAVDTTYQPLSRFPKVEQDITLKVPATTTYQEVIELLESSLLAEAPEDTSFELKPLDIYVDEQQKSHKNIAFRLTITAYDRTLTAEAVNSLLDMAASEANTAIGAERI